MPDVAAEAGPRVVHATSIALGGVAALIRGTSGAGKSDLALRCIAGPAGGLVAGECRLVADDRVALSRREGALFASAPTSIAGLIEVRGLGILKVPASGPTRVVLAVDLTQDPIERLPDPADRDVIEGIAIRRLLLRPFEASAPLKVLLALDRLSSGDPEA